MFTKSRRLFYFSNGEQTQKHFGERAGITQWIEYLPSTSVTRVDYFRLEANEG